MTSYPISASPRSPGSATQVWREGGGKKKKKRSSCSGCFLLRANDKFSDNRRVLIDVSAPLSPNHWWISSGEWRREWQRVCVVLWISSHLIHPVLKAVNAQLTSGTVQPAPSSCWRWAVRAVPSPRCRHWKAAPYEKQAI